MSVSSLWQGRIDAEDGAAGHRWHQVVKSAVKDTQVNAQDVVLAGYPNDTGVAANKGRVGAAGGPNALRQNLASLPWHLPVQLYDAGDSNISTTLADTQQHYASLLGRHLHQGAHVIGLGGGHDIAWGSFQALNEARPDKRIGIINLDAHLDLRRFDSGASSGSPFRQISAYCQQHNKSFDYACLGISDAANTTALLDYARESGTLTLNDYAFSAQHALECVQPLLDTVEELYVTVCMDVFPAAVAPGVSAPAGLGIPPAEAVLFIRQLAAEVRTRSLAWRLSDIAELNPVYDSDHRTARLAARMVYELTQAMDQAAR
ncbi:formimidoylglutamase [Alteromonas sp. ASW11-19]|uniref:Formimidoylglutamase n=1 Tax=Alteromonas salexigens TaxID=2982530 RepID=A0ABT2VMZ2_9ALTE|nr:formimidoylglutamase [Alteromonas salexigens]MCU7554258.1 formimidoylglutamase [Alteromonas salexigens]